MLSPTLWQVGVLVLKPEGHSLALTGRRQRNWPLTTHGRRPPTIIGGGEGGGGGGEGDGGGGKTSAQLSPKIW